uniref:Spexin hormone n=1 Tax=Salarias fasciatus TaxID=181472 RepID=A0A672IFA3_SALFA
FFLFTEELTMSVIFTLLMASLLSQCWAAPQRRNWTPQAILYLKGARKNTFKVESDGKDGLKMSPQINDGSMLNVLQRDIALCRLAPDIFQNLFLWKLYISCFQL